MKSIIVIILLIFIIPCYAVNNVNSLKSDTVCIYKVIKIDKTRKKKNGTNKAFVILVQDSKTDSIRTIVSLRSKNKTGNIIKVGKYYALKLERYYETDYLISTGWKLSLHINNVTMHIPMDKNTYNIFTSQDLKGLYYIPAHVISEPQYLKPDR